MLGDVDGIILIFSALVLDVVNKTEQIMSTENQLRSMILKGMDPQEAYLKYRLF